MANDKNKFKELVSNDEDPTAELEILSFRDDVERESDANTFGLADNDDGPSVHGQSISELRSDLQSRTKTIGRLQYDIEQLRSKWLGLETEIKAREAIVGNLSREIDDLREMVGRKEKLIKKRDVTIRTLKAEIREREETHRTLAQQFAEQQQSSDEAGSSADEVHSELQAANDEIERLRGQIDRSAKQSADLADHHQPPNDLRAQLSRTEQYADDLRIKLKDLSASHDDLSRDRDRLARAVARSTQSIHDMSREIAEAGELVADLKLELEKAEKAHEEEMRILRFELGEAQNTVAEASDLNSQLASDLVDTRSYKEELERMLSENEEQSQQRIERLEKDLGKLVRSAEDYEQKLESKSAAINVLLNELTRKSEQIDAIGEIEDVIHDIDDRMSERFDDVEEAAEAGARPAGKERDKITRVLIGRIGDQVLRFPLFKDRLTIGRTEDNDIQLKLSYISRRHAVVMSEGDTTRVIDWGSKNGVYVNSNRVKEHFLSNGDIVAVGDAKFRYEERKKRDA